MLVKFWGAFLFVDMDGMSFDDVVYMRVRIPQQV